MSHFNGNSVGILSAATTFGAATIGVAFVPKLSGLMYIKVIAYVSYAALVLLLLSFFARQLLVQKKRKS